ncbi:hypothetical protein Pla123a_19360 [Posidoniimonas polymericola]|uniref:Uncharacterized protein n=1 Tax=Posidoniimonas polymericola TaxID=2528002 RepID=A0A5C5YQZ6_9BACT|nr:hypothetical protein [Posidoniimonas polymericola]TWT77279.1 hypothetical protein Pla123a_19360 [Posidoniimonas polymericola]
MTERQSSLAIDVAGYATLGDSLDAYLATISEAGGGVSTDVTPDAALAATARDESTLGAQAAVAPEPLGRVLALLASCLLAAGLRRRSAA